MATVEDISAVLDALPDGALIVSLEGRVLLANASLERISGFPPLRIVGKPVEFLVPDAHREVHVRQRTGFFLAPAVRPMNTGIDTKLLGSDGEEIAVEIHISPIEWEGRSAVLAVVRPAAD